MQVDPTVIDRVTKALNFEEPDRVSIWESLQNAAVYEHFAPGVPFPECAAIACAELGIDATYGCMAPVEELGAVGGMVHAGGTVWGVEPVFRSSADLRDYSPGKPDAAAIEEQTIAEHESMQNLYGPRVMYLPQSGGCGFLPGYDTRTFTVVASAMQEDISSLRSFWDSRVEHAVMRNEVIARHRLAPVVQCCEDVAFKTGLMVSRELLQQEFFPRMKQIIAPLKAAGIKAIWHSDGDITEVLDDAVECGFDGINPVDPSAGMDIGEVRKRFGRKLILVGNVGADHVLSRGTPDEVRADVRRCLREAGGGGGHLLQCGDGQVMPDCPVENVIAYCEEAARHSLALQEKGKTQIANTGGRGCDEPSREKGKRKVYALEGEAVTSRPGRRGKHMPDMKPNVLVALVDQMRYHAMAPAGNEQVHTPNMTRMADEGACMVNAVSNSPVCTPARACLLTGLYPLTHTVLVNNSMLPTDIPSMGTLLKTEGYDTAYIGKWHLAGEGYFGSDPWTNDGQNGYIPPGAMRHGFDTWAVHHCQHNYWNASYFRDTPDRIPIEGWEPDAQTDIAIETLREHAARPETERNPFAMVVSWGTPHTPFTAPEEFLVLYDPDALTFRPNVRITEEMAACAEHGMPGLSPEELLRHHTHNYYAAVSNIDHNLGRLLDELKRSGMYENTIVVFTSDHGEMLGSHGQWSKSQPRDESVRVPMLIRFPGSIVPGLRPELPFSLTDLLPTLFGLAGIHTDTAFEGLDFSAALRGEGMDAPGSSFLVWPCSAVTWGKRWVDCKDEVRGYERGFLTCYRGIRTLTHTYARRHEGPWMLYDNVADPYQLTNLVEKGDTVPPELDRELDAWLERTGDAFGTTDDYKELIELETGLVHDRAALKRQ